MEAVQELRKLEPERVEEKRRVETRKREERRQAVKLEESDRCLARTVLQQLRLEISVCQLANIYKIFWRPILSIFLEKI
jgi:hypothetical protein